MLSTKHDLKIVATGKRNRLNEVDCYEARNHNLLQ